MIGELRKSDGGMKMKTCEDCNLFDACNKISKTNKCVCSDVAHDLGIIAELQAEFVQSNRLVRWLWMRFRKKHPLLLKPPMRWYGK